jgi:signal transduction histidine kinase
MRKLSKKNSDKRILVGITIALLLAATAWTVVWRNLAALEQQRVLEHQNSAKKLAEIATTFVMGKEYNNLLALMQYQTQTTAIRFMAYYLDRERILQVGREIKSGLSLPVPELDGRAEQAIRQSGEFLCVDSLLSFQKEMAGRQHVLRIAYSLQGFHERKRWVLAAVGGVIALLCAIALLLVLLQRAHAQLKQEEKNKAMMVRAIAHDALHYVTVIQMIHDNWLSAAKRGKEVRDLAGNITRIRESNDSLIKLLEDLKFNEYLRQGRIINQPGRIQWIPMLETMIADFSPMLSQKSVKVELIHQGEPYWFYADRELLKRVVANLVHNAFKFTRPDSTVKIWFQLEGSRLKTFVSDQGPGIPPEEWEHIFEPSVRLENDAYVRPEDKRGTGLGLSNARAFIRLSGGELGVFSSQAGEGTIFYFTLPVVGPMAEAGK